MRVVVVAAGSRGDAVPFGALARGLAGAGHDVTVVTHRTFTALVPEGVPVVEVDSDPDALMSGQAARALVRPSPRALNRSRHEFADFLDSFARPTAGALAGADVVVASTFAVAAVHEAIRRDVPVVRAHLWPELTGLEGPMPLMPYAWLLPGPARRGARGALRTMERHFGGVEGVWRGGRLDLASRHPVGLTTQTAGTLHAFSPLVEPELVRRVGTENGCVSGWWHAPDERALSPRTEAALASRTPTVYVGFGSMHQRSPQALVETVARACERLGVRALLQLTGATNSADGRVDVIGDEPHEALFRRVEAVVHHGGSGTTGAVLRSGTPSVVVPHFADQYHWAHRLSRLGVAPPPLPRRLLTASFLERRLERAMEDETRRRAQQLGHRVAAEDGVATAVAHIHRLMGMRAP